MTGIMISRIRGMSKMTQIQYKVLIGMLLMWWNGAILGYVLPRYQWNTPSTYLSLVCILGGTAWFLIGALISLK